jgi:hypothetical protein
MELEIEDRDDSIPLEESDSMSRFADTKTIAISKDRMLWG